MENEHEDVVFLRDLVKTSRQKIHQVKWADRDGSARLTTLSQAEYTRLNAMARAQKISPGDVLRQAAHIPVAR